MVRRLRDGLRLVSTVVHEFAEPTSDYLQALDSIARDVADVIPDACVILLRTGDQLSMITNHDSSTSDDGGRAHRCTDLINRPFPLRDSRISAGVLANGPLIEPSLDADRMLAPLVASEMDERILNGATGMIVVPLAARGETIGVLWVLRHGHAMPPLDELDLEIVIDLANHAALAVSNARLFKQLERAERLRVAEERAVQASSLLDAIVENIPDMVFVKDADRLAFVRLNRAGEDLLGVPRDQLIGKTDHELFPPGEAQLFHAKDREALAAQRLVEINEEPVQTKNGVRWLHTKKVPLLDSAGKPRYLLGISHDITGRKQAIAELSAAKLAAEDANRELESFSYSVAHDLRTPLRAIDGFSQALVEDYGDKLDVEGRRYLQRVRDAAQRMAELIDDLLTLSRVTRSELRRDRVDLSALAHTLLAAFQRVDSERRVEIHISPGITTDADPQLVAIALDNLLGNAWKFTSKRAVARIEVGETKAYGVPAYFVRDNGAGFDMTYRDKLFGVFQRLHPETEFPGTGIGLATVARIAQRHRGRAWAVGVPGEGATFFFTLMEPQA